jgi:hypothetical protein
MRSPRDRTGAITPMCCGRCPMSQAQRLTSGRRFAKYGSNISSLDIF